MGSRPLVSIYFAWRLPPILSYSTVLCTKDSLVMRSQAKDLILNISKLLLQDRKANQKDI